MTAAGFVRRNSAWLFALALTVATFLSYKPAWHGGFIWDDDYYVVRNELLTVPDGLRRIWFSLDSPSQYFPLTYTSFRIERALWGLDPTGYHLVNIALHVANALLVWRVLLRLGIPSAMLAAAIFALHPVQVESVAWITERKNVLMGVLFLLALRCWIAFVDRERARTWSWYALALVCYALALSSKTTACTLPAALLIVLWFRKQRITLTRIAQVIPFVVLGLAMGAVTIWWERYHQGTRGAMFSMPVIERVLVASRAIWFYLGKLIWPAKLTFIYPRWEIHAGDPVQCVWLVACIVAAVLIIAARRRFGRGPEVAAVYYIATLSPLLGFIMLYTFRYTFVADHYQYLATIGPFALAAAAITKTDARQIRLVLAFAIVATLAFLTWRQAQMYADIETLWRTTIQRSPNSWMAYNNLGIELAQQRRDAEAIQNYERTVALQPKFPEAHYNLANSLLKTGDAARAIAESRTAISLQANDPDAHTSLGNALLAGGRRDEARAQYEIACRLRPNDPDANYNLGLMLLQDGDFPNAIGHFQTTLRQRENPTTRVMLANALLATHRNADAITQFSAVLKSSPQNVIALCNLALALATSADPALRDGQRALQLAQQANALTGERDPVVLRSLAAAYAETRDMSNAVQTAERALQLANDTGQRELAEQLQHELALYRDGMPYHE